MSEAQHKQSVPSAMLSVLSENKDKILNDLVDTKMKCLTQTIEKNIGFTASILANHSSYMKNEIVKFLISTVNSTDFITMLCDSLSSKDKKSLATLMMQYPKELNSVINNNKDFDVMLAVQEAAYFQSMASRAKKSLEDDKKEIKIGTDRDANLRKEEKKKQIVPTNASEAQKQQVVPQPVATAASSSSSSKGPQIITYDNIKTVIIMIRSMFNVIWNDTKKGDFFQDNEFKCIFDEVKKFVEMYNTKINNWDNKEVKYPCLSIRLSSKKGEKGSGYLNFIVNYNKDYETFEMMFYDSYSDGKSGPKQRLCKMSTIRTTSIENLVSTHPVYIKSPELMLVCQSIIKGEAFMNTFLSSTKGKDGKPLSMKQLVDNYIPTQIAYHKTKK
jgi:hypothetical protein